MTGTESNLKQRYDDVEALETNYERYVQYGLSLLTQLPKYYQHAPLPVQQKLIGLIFPEKLVFEDEQYRTTEINDVLLLLMQKRQEVEANKKGTDRVPLLSQSRRVVLLGRLSNRFREDLRRLWQLRPIISVDVLRPRWA